MKHPRLTAEDEDEHAYGSADSVRIDGQCSSSHGWMPSSKT
jgi:hypothetical protein